jgi:peptidyl-prolyl cis-trans isomerase C
MKRSVVAVITLLAAASAFAQTAPESKKPVDDQQKIVAVINGEVITKAKLDALYSGMGAQMRAQYDKSGGKLAFLDNYVAKRLLLQEALKSGFDKKPDVQIAMEAAKESALFDQYIKDVVAPSVVTSAEIRKYYDEHTADFALPESAKVRHIVITWNNKPKQDALEKIKTVATEIRSGAPSPRDKTPETQQILLNRFIVAARTYSEDGAATAGGDLGWVTKGSLDPGFEEAAFALKPMTMSGIVESQFGYHLIFVEDTKPARTQAFNEAKDDIREFLMTQKAADVMGSVKRLTNELRANSKIAFYPENLN